MNKLLFKTLSVAGQVPTSLAEGELAINLGDTPPTLFIGDGTAVRRVGPVAAGPVAPVGPKDGTLWLDDQGVVQYYFNGQWHKFGGGLPYTTTQQSVTATATTTVDLSQGRTILLDVSTPVTDFHITDPSNLPVGYAEIRLTTDGSKIDWTGIDDWVGAKPSSFPAGNHIIRLIKIDGLWYAQYAGSEIPRVRPFKMTVKTLAPNTQFSFPLQAGTVNAQIEWGDGSSPSQVVSNTDANKTHTYAAAGTYQIKVTGTVEAIGIYLGNTPAYATSAPLIISVDAWGDLGLVNATYAFRACVNLVSVAAGNPQTTGDTTGLTSALGMFRDCTSLVNVGLFDTSKVTNANYMFYHDSALSGVPDFDFGECTDFSSIFEGCTSLAFANQINTAKGVKFIKMFMGCVNLGAIPQLDLTHGTDLSYMFSGCKSIAGLPVFHMPKQAWDGTRFCYQCSGLLALPPLDFSKCTNLQEAFYQCTSLLSFPNTPMPEVTTLYNTWGGCSSLATFPPINLPKATNITKAWEDTTALTHFPLIQLPLVDNAVGAWQASAAGKGGLVDFPALQLPLCTDLSYAWENQVHLEHFPAIAVPKVLKLINTWAGCTGLLDFSALNLRTANDLTFTWDGCTKIQTFPACLFRDAVTFSSTWVKCSALTNFQARLNACTVGATYNNAWSQTNLSETAKDQILGDINTANATPAASPNNKITISGGTPLGVVGQGLLPILQGKGWDTQVA